MQVVATGSEVPATTCITGLSHLHTCLQVFMEVVKSSSEVSITIYRSVCWHLHNLLQILV